MSNKMTNDGHMIDDPMVVVGTKPDFEGLGLTKEEHKMLSKYHIVQMCEYMLSEIENAIEIFGENRSLGNVADNLRAIIEHKSKQLKSI